MATMSPTTVCYEAAGVVDADRVDAAPGAALVAWDAPAVGGKPARPTVLAAGSPHAVASHPAAAGAPVVRIPEAVLLPALVNAHTHLDLTHIGPRACPALGGFAAWGAMILAERRTDDAGIAASVALGVERSLAGGVVAVGDIAGIGSLAPVEALRRSPLSGVSFVEFFGLGDRQAGAADAMADVLDRTPLDDRAVRVGLQPHAPYSAGSRLYQAAAALGRGRGAPLATHLAEMLDERVFIATGRGPLLGLLEKLGFADGAALAEFGRGLTPVAHLAAALAEARWLVAHGNDLTDDDIGILRRCGATVVYCPRCHEYFGHPKTLGPHPYRRLQRAGVRVALGTDSIVNLPPVTDGGSAPEGALPVMSTLDEARLLFRRDGESPRALLAMATTTGGAALGLDADLFRFAGGPMGGMIAVDVSGTDEKLPSAERALCSDAPPALLAPPG